mgnify:CR=1 FL=1
MAKAPHLLKFNDLSNPWQRFRSQTGMSQVELAALLKIGQSAISTYEAGGTPEVIFAKRLVALARERRVRMSMDELYAHVEA